MMDLVVDDVQQQRIDGHLPLTERRIDLLKAVRMMRPHLPLVVVLSDPDLKAAARLRPANRAELSRTLVAQDLWTAREQTMRELRRLGALVVESAPKDAGVDAMNAYIEVKRRQLL